MYRKLWFIALALMFSAHALANQTPEDVVESAINIITEELRENRDTYRDDHEALRSLVREHLIANTDEVYSARLILGRHGRSASDEQIERFAKALTSMLVQRYADGLLEMESDDKVEIMPRSRDESANIVRVRTRIHLASGTRVPVDYVFRQNEGRWLVFDVVVEGISYINTFRNQFNTEIQRNGLEKTIERLEAGEIDIEAEQNA